MDMQVVVPQAARPRSATSVVQVDELSIPHARRTRGGLRGRQPWLARLACAAGALLLAACSTVGPPAGHAVLDPVPGVGPLIGLAADFYPPAAPASAGVEQLTRSGIPRFKRLSVAERSVENRTAAAVEQDPVRALQAAGRLAAASGSAEQPIFEVDAVKYLFDGYGVGRSPATAREAHVRMTMNHAMHPASVAVARLAFIDRLDALSRLPEGDPGRVVFVTSGGCAAGKGDLYAMARSVLGPGVRFGAIWDAAGEGNALENAWVLEAARARGLRVVFGWAEADPATRYESVLARAQHSGRVVDVLTFVDSYVYGGAVFRRFLGSQQYREAQAAGWATSFGIAPGEFDPASLKDPRKPAYPQARALGLPGTPLRVQDIMIPAERTHALQAALRVLEAHLQTARAAGRDTDDLLQGALGNALKFLDDEPAEVAALLREAHRRLAAGGRRST